MGVPGLRIRLGMRGAGVLAATAKDLVNPEWPGIDGVNRNGGPSAAAAGADAGAQAAFACTFSSTKLETSAMRS